MKNISILSFVIIILCGSLIFGSTQNIKLNNRVNFLLNQMDTMAGLLKDAYALEGKWKHRYDSVVKKADSCVVFYSDTEIQDGPPLGGSYPNKTVTGSNATLTLTGDITAKGSGNYKPKKLNTKTINNHDFSNKTFRMYSTTNLSNGYCNLYDSLQR